MTNLRSITPRHSPALPLDASSDSSSAPQTPPTSTTPPLWLIDETGKQRRLEPHETDALSLERLVRTLPREGLLLPCALGAFIVHDVASALVHLQADDARGTARVHGHLRPEQILILRDGSVKLLTAGPGQPPPIERGRPRRLGGIATHVSYLAPEQILGLPVDLRADVFALGALLWELLLGPPLFRGHDDDEADAAVLANEVPPPSALRPETPRRLEATVLRALAPDRRQRQPSLEALASELTLRTSDRPKLAKYSAAWVAKLLGPMPAHTGARSRRTDTQVTPLSSQQRSMRTRVGSPDLNNEKTVPATIPPAQRSAPPPRPQPPPIPPAARGSTPDSLPAAERPDLKLVPRPAGRERKSVVVVQLPVRPRTRDVSPIDGSGDGANTPTSFVTVRPTQPSWLLDVTPTGLGPPSAAGRPASSSRRAGLARLAAVAMVGFGLGVLWGRTNPAGPSAATTAGVLVGPLVTPLEPGPGPAETAVMRVESAPRTDGAVPDTRPTAAPKRARDRARGSRRAIAVR